MFSTRFLAACAVGITIFGVGFLYAIYAPKTYQATGMVQIHSDETSPVTMERRLEVFKKHQLATNIDSKLHEEERRQLLLPYREMTVGGKLSPATTVLLAFSEFHQIGDTDMIRVSYEHRDPVMAANICNLYMKAYIDYLLKQEIDKRMQPIEELRKRTAPIRKRLETAEMDLAIIRVKRSKSTADALEVLSSKDTQLLKLIETEQAALTQLTEEMANRRSGMNLMQPGARIVEEARIPRIHKRPNLPLWILFSVISALIVSTLCFVLTNHSLQVKH